MAGQILITQTCSCELKGPSDNLVEQLTLGVYPLLEWRSIVKFSDTSSRWRLNGRILIAVPLSQSTFQKKRINFGRSWNSHHAVVFGGNIIEALNAEFSNEKYHPF